MSMEQLDRLEQEWMLILSIVTMAILVGVGFFVFIALSATATIL